MHRPPGCHRQETVHQTLRIALVIAVGAETHPSLLIVLVVVGRRHRGAGIHPNLLIVVLIMVGKRHRWEAEIHPTLLKVLLVVGRRGRGAAAAG